MIRRLVIPLLGSGLLLAASAGSAFAKCEGPDPKPEFCSQVVVGWTTSGDMQVGVAQTITFTVTQGEQPFDAMGVVLQFINAAGGTRIDVPATATNTPGLWRAEVKLPANGIWNTYAQVVTNTGAAYRMLVQRLRVVLPPAPPVTTPVTTPPVNPALPVLPIALVLAGIAAAAIGGQVIGGRSRRRTAKTAAPAPGNAAITDRA
jgi:hypothetical protein